MTPQEHNKYVGIAHLVHGGLMSLLWLLMMGMFIGILGTAPNGPPAGLIVVLTLFLGFFYGLMTVPSFLAAYGLLKKKRWAKTAAIVAAVTAASNFPIGTAVCVYTFWFLFSEPGKAIFEKPNYMLPPSQQAWASNVNQRQEQPEYAPPPTPPDWR